MSISKVWALAMAMHAARAVTARMVVYCGKVEEAWKMDSQSRVWTEMENAWMEIG